MNKLLKFLPLEKSSAFSLITLVGALAMLLLIIVPVPSMILDILLLANIGMSAVIFLLAIQAKNVLEFSVLPTVLIFTTLLRIVLNVSSSRLILGEATGGKVIDAIGKITVGGDYVVGVIIFAIITLVMFLVINKGTGRVAEVSARFVLDSLPGKQMSIDSDLNSGVIDVRTAQARRLDLQKETDFYKSMDGATNFIKGDAIAGLIITAVNVIGGLIMGMTRHGMSVGDAASVYTILSVGDGLVNQLPSLLIASASAFMITKGNSKEGMNMEIVLQFLRYKEPLRIISGIFALIGVVALVGLAEGIPWWVCFVISGGCYYITTMDASKFEAPVEEEAVIEEIMEEAPENILHVDKILMHVGTNVATAIVQSDGNDRGMVANELKFRIEVMRDKIKKNYGVKIPNVRITDDDYIPSNAFLVRISNMPTPTLEIKPNCIFATFFDDNMEIDFGEEAEIRVLGLKGYWIAKEMMSDVESMGAITHTIFDIIVLYLEYIIENNLEKIITREDVKQYKDEVQLYNAAIIDEITRKQIENSVIQKVVQSLLAEKIPIKNFEYILESIGDYYADQNGGGNFVNLMMFIRKRIANVITEGVVQNGMINVINFSEESNQLLVRKLRGDTDESVEIGCANIYAQMVSTHMQLTDMGQNFVFLCHKQLRLDLFNAILDCNVKINIIAYEELPKGARMEVLKTI